MSPVRLSIRPGAYRGKSGFNVSGRDGWGRSVRIFARTRSGAEGIVRAYKAHAAGSITESERQREVSVRLDPRRRARRSRPRRRDAERSSLGMFAGHSYHSALTAARAEAKKCRTPWYIKQFGASWYMTDTHPALPYVKVHVDERAVKHAMGDPRRKRSRRRDPMHKPTIYEALASKLGRRPTNDELRREVQRIKTEAYIEVASRGKLSHQRRRRR